MIVRAGHDGVRSSYDNFKMKSFLRILFEIHIELKVPLLISLLLHFLAVTIISVNKGISIFQALEYGAYNYLFLKDVLPFPLYWWFAIICELVVGLFGIYLVAFVIT
jgi:hypothetical protein